MGLSSKQLPRVIFYCYDSYVRTCFSDDCYMFIDIRYTFLLHWNWIKHKSLLYCFIIKLVMQLAKNKNIIYIYRYFIYTLRMLVFVEHRNIWNKKNEYIKLLKCLSTYTYNVKTVQLQGLFCNFVIRYRLTVIFFLRTLILLWLMTITSNMLALTITSD